MKVSTCQEMEMAISCKEDNFKIPVTFKPGIHHATQWEKTNTGQNT